MTQKENQSIMRNSKFQNRRSQGQKNREWTYGKMINSCRFFFRVIVLPLQQIFHENVIVLLLPCVSVISKGDANCFDPRCKGCKRLRYFTAKDLPKLLSISECQKFQILTSICTDQVLSLNHFPKLSQQLFILAMQSRIKLTRLSSYCMYNLPKTWRPSSELATYSEWRREKTGQKTWIWQRQNQ